MRHIPEEELHAYLDQALSRSQCVEIERHLARCPRCQLLRDDIAALRDRTTELLARLGPPPILPPAFETLKARRVERNRARWRRIGMGAWAATVVAAVALGWQVNRRAHGASLPGSIAAAPPIPAAIQAPTVTSTASRHAPRGARPGRTAPAKQVEPVTSRDPAPAYASAVETDPSTLLLAESPSSPRIGSVPLEQADLVTQPVSIDPGLQGVWRTIAPDSGGSPLTREIPRVPGLPVVQMRVQPGNGASEVTAVDQVLESGDVIRTIAGPATRVGSLVGLDSGRLNPHGTDPSGGRMTVTIRQGDRMVAVTGPSQALGSLLSRVNVTRRRY